MDVASTAMAVGFVSCARMVAVPPPPFGALLTLESHNRYAILFRVHTAKKPETRAARIEKYVAMLERHERLHP
jgi:hypothetical protein